MQFNGECNRIYNRKLCMFFSLGDLRVWYDHMHGCIVSTLYSVISLYFHLMTQNPLGYLIWLGSEWAGIRLFGSCLILVFGIKPR